METILLLEDDPISLRVLGTVLREKGGYTVLDASDPEGAIRLCKEHTGPIHLMVADVILRSASGREVMGRIGSVRPEMGVLFISGSDPGDLIAKDFLRPGDPFVMKPFTVGAFLESVRSVLKKSASA
jgi:DNA-binding NtrC family response regulator